MASYPPMMDSCVDAFQYCGSDAGRWMVSRVRVRARNTGRCQCKRGDEPAALGRGRCLFPCAYALPKHQYKRFVNLAAQLMPVSRARNGAACRRLRRLSGCVAENNPSRVTQAWDEFVEGVCGLKPQAHIPYQRASLSRRVPRRPPKEVKSAG